MDLTRHEKDALLAQNPSDGDVLYLIRNHPHVSKLYPFLHIDILYIEYNNGKFYFLYKEHRPVDESS